RPGFEPRSRGYESSALSDLSYRPYGGWRGGIGPLVTRLQIKSSTTELAPPFLKPAPRAFYFLRIEPQDMVSGAEFATNPGVMSRLKPVYFQAVNKSGASISAAISSRLQT